jgi:glycosyltransferase involved in cell wall biosynthesis
LREVPVAARPFLGAQLERIRRWDMDAARRVDHFIANSRITQQRIAEFWGRDSTIVYPPVDVHRFALGKPEDFFLIVGELVPHKRVGRALHAAERAGKRVKVVGAGPDLPRLRSRFGSGAEFLGHVQDDHLADLMARARAVVIPAVEEFGIVAVEAHAAGRPVIGPDRGGTTETIVEGENGVLFGADDFDALAEAMREVDFDRFDQLRVRRSALQFRPEMFRHRIRTEVGRLAGTSVTRGGPAVPRSRFSSRETADQNARDGALATRD